MIDCSRSGRTRRGGSILGSEAVHHEGGCSCSQLRYRLTSAPLFVHCCHCRWCQRESGSAFIVNALIETDRVELLAGEVDVVDTPTASGQGQRVARCPRCRVAVWSHYAYGKLSDAVRFVRVGSLDEPDALPPDIHIFTSSRLRWLLVPPDVPSVPGFYKASDYWPRESLERRAALFEASGSATSAS